METLWWLVGKFFWLMAILMGLTSFYCLIRLKLLTFVKLAFFASLALGIGGCADEQAQLAAMTPEQRAEYELKQEQKKQEEKAAKEANKSKVEIFNEISQKLHNLSLQEIIFCQIVVSYFVQSCGVFDAIAK